MKNNVLLLTGALAVMTAFTAKTNRFSPDGETWKADTKTSELEWTGKKLTGEHSGTLKLSSGTVTVKNNEITGGKFEIDMNSINSKDLEGEWKTKLEGHLKSADFFDVANFPKATFEITSVIPLPAGFEGGFTHTVKGNLTIKGKTNQMAFNVIMKAKDNKISASGNAVVDRSKFDVRYGSKTFFADIGDKVIFDDIAVKINLVVVK